MWNRLLSPYWLLFSLSAWWALAPGSGYVQAGIFMVLTVMIGLRRAVGGDWRRYALLFNRGRTYPFPIAVCVSDPGYMLLGRLLARLHLDVGALNFVCASIFSAGLTLYVGRNILPGLQLLIATPVLIVIVAMGFTRQSAAAGFLLLSLAASAQGSQPAALLFMLAGISFHVSLLLMLPVVHLANHPVLDAQTGAVAGLCAGAAFCVATRVYPRLRRFLSSYGNAAGALFRMLPTMVALILAVFFEQQLALGAYGRSIVGYLSAISALLVTVSLVASTLADRFGFYTVVLQMLVIPAALASIEDPLAFHLALGATVASYTGLFVAWVRFSPFSRFWFPYRSYLNAPAALIAHTPAPLTAKHEDGVRRPSPRNPA